MATVAGAPPYTKRFVPKKYFIQNVLTPKQKGKIGIPKSVYETNLLNDVLQGIGFRVYESGSARAQARVATVAPPPPPYTKRYVPKRFRQDV